MNDKKPNHGHSRPTSGAVSRPLIDVLGCDDGDDNVTCRHADGSNNQDRLAAKFVNVHDGRHRCQPHDDTDDTRGKE